MDLQLFIAEASRLLFFKRRFFKAVFSAFEENTCLEKTGDDL